MLGFVQTMLGARPNPVGIALGSDCLRMAQVQRVGDHFKLAVASRTEIPLNHRGNQEGRLSFYAEHIERLIAPFRGRQAVLSVPSDIVQIVQLRLPEIADEREMGDAINEAARGKMTFDPTDAVLRPLIAGDVLENGETRKEIVLMAAPKDWVQRFLEITTNAGIEVIGLNMEPCALIDCFAHVYRREVDRRSVRCFVDIGAGGTRAIIAQGSNILFARNLDIGGDHFTHAAAEALHVSFVDAKTLRIKLAANEAAEAAALGSGRASTLVAAVETGVAHGQGMPSTPGPTERRVEIPLNQQECDAPTWETEDPNHFLGDAGRTLSELADKVEEACQIPMEKLAEQIDACRQQHSQSFPSLPIERIIFVGAEARQRGLCRRLALRLKLPAQMGEPMCRMERASDIGIESGIDRRSPQPGWAVAIGLSMGPATAE